MGKIMLVDDSRITKRLMTKAIEEMAGDYDIITASNGLEAIEKFKSDKPDLVFMDINMPEMDGLTATRKIIEFDNSALIIMLSAHKSQFERVEAAKSGAKDFVTKPINFDEIRITIQKYID